MNPLHCLVPSFCLSFIVTYLLNVFHHGCSSEFEEEECVSSCNIMSSALLLAQCHFEHLEQLWMGIWQHTHTVTTTEVSPDLGEFTEILDDVCVEMIPLRYR